MKVLEDQTSGQDMMVQSSQTRLRHALHRLHRGILITSSTLTPNLSTSDPLDAILDGRNGSVLEGNDSSVPDEAKVDETTRKLYLYCTPPLIFLCILSVAINLRILLSVHWIRRPLSPTLHISLSLAAADAFSGIALAVGLIMNSFIPIALGHTLSGVQCFLMGLEAVRLGSIIITVAHLMALAVNHYLGILRPLHYLSIMTHRNTTFLIVLLWILPLSFFLAYFSLVENEGFQSKGCLQTSFLLHKKFRLMFSSLFFCPFIVMVCIYTHIFHIVRKHQASRLRFSRAGSLHRGTNGVQQNSSQQMARSVKAIHTTLYILGSYVVGWMPGTILYTLVCKDCLLDLSGLTKNGIFFVICAVNLLIILKTIVNPIIYAARMQEIKVATRRMRGWFCGCLGQTSGSEAIGMGHSSEGIQSNRPSLSRTAVCRWTSNMSIRNPRNGSYTYTYTGNGAQHVHTNTVL
ncbi:trace amine-associated receptor 8a [Cephus cinctus]|uniref:Trace amine-associated receptor 8a n=1 Tax=Cephus cinctus TaxID=211228 RepID=A0AAJ7FTZ2_CEPCN|nr:trace amine-associated receptor 8a [Cephus cinctus]XP_024946709.1 trace amine-associated receptor 8a [Cephus cinctus]XP_024946710.1 trace amine-associated receptor 8a [Cephus cinctus]